MTKLFQNKQGKLVKGLVTSVMSQTDHLTNRWFLGGDFVGGWTVFGVSEAGRPGDFIVRAIMICLSTFKQAYKSISKLSGPLAYLCDVSLLLLLFVLLLRQSSETWYPFNWRSIWDQSKQIRSLFYVYSLIQKSIESIDRSVLPPEQ